MKYEKALEYYNKGDYYRALQLFDAVQPFYRGTMEAEKIGYYIAMSYYNQGDYILADFHFSNFIKVFPKSIFAKECTYLAAYCNYLESPKYSLDQTYTNKAIEGFQLFANKYPKSDSVELCNNYIDELRYKLQKKAFEISKLYLKTEDYKAAIESFNNDLKDFPYTPFKEESMFLLLKSHFLLAENSIEEKKYERYQNTIEAYEKFIAYFNEENQFQKEASGLYEKAMERLKQLKEKQTENL